MNEDRSRNDRPLRAPEPEGLHDHWYDRVLTRLGLKARDSIRHDLEDALVDLLEIRAAFGRRIATTVCGDALGGAPFPERHVRQVVLERPLLRRAGRLALRRGDRFDPRLALFARLLQQVQQRCLNCVGRHRKHSFAQQTYRQYTRNCGRNRS